VEYFITDWSTWDDDLFANALLLFKDTLKTAGHMMGATLRQNPPKAIDMCQPCWDKTQRSDYYGTPEFMAEFLGESEEAMWEEVGEYPNEYTPEQYR